VKRWYLWRADGLCGCGAGEDLAQVAVARGLGHVAHLVEAGGDVLRRPWDQTQVPEAVVRRRTTTRVWDVSAAPREACTLKELLETSSIIRDNNYITH
jgi:hypothetical protein